MKLDLLTPLTPLIRKNPGHFKAKKPKLKKGGQILAPQAEQKEGEASKEALSELSSELFALISEGAITFNAQSLKMIQKITASNDESLPFLSQGYSSSPTNSPKDTIAVSKLWDSESFLSKKLQKVIPNHYVGELQEAWQFPSDHLPIAMRVNDVEMTSWNVLSNQYFDWVTGNSQGLSRSMLTELNKPAFSEEELERLCEERPDISKKELALYAKLTQRDMLILKDVAHMMESNDMISLQECSPEFVLALKNVLPLFPGFDIVAADPKCRTTQELIIYNTNQFDLVESHTTYDSFPSAGKRMLQEAIFRDKESDQLYQIFNCHLPGDPTKPAPQELAEAMKKRALPKAVVMAVGDMNFEEHEMAKGFKDAGVNKPVEIYNEYNTNISPYSFIAKCIDHCIIYGDTPVVVEMLKPEEILPGLDSMVDMLTPGYIALESSAA